MSDQRSIAARSSEDDGAPSVRRGQTLVEFALVLPMLLVLLLGVADFGRVFQAGIMVESASRNAAETAAQEYLQALRQAPGSPIDYESLHLAAARVACRELQKLPNTTFVPDSDGGHCPSMPVIRVCIRDNPAVRIDSQCGLAQSGFAGAIPPQCERLDGDDDPTGADPPWEPAWVGSPEASAYVEVRICYVFTTLFNLDLALPMNTGISLGDIYLQDRSVFTVADY